MYPMLVLILFLALGMVLLTRHAMKVTKRRYADQSNDAKLRRDAVKLEYEIKLSEMALWHETEQRTLSCAREFVAELGRYTKGELQGERAKVFEEFLETTLPWESLVPLWDKYRSLK